VNPRQFITENFAGDLEYHPRRGLVCLFLAGSAFVFWYFAPRELKFTVLPLVFLLGSFSLAIKGVFLLRRSSEGLGMSEQELAALSDPKSHKALPSLPSQVAQVVQDFGSGSLLLWPILNFGADIDKSWTDPPRLTVFLVGAGLFAAGLVTRKLANQAARDAA